MADVKTFPIGRTVRAETDNDENALEELKTRIQGRISYGTDAPDSKTQGNVYLRISDTLTDPVIVYVKNSKEQWIGLTGMTTNSNLVNDDGTFKPVTVIRGIIYPR